MSSRASRGRCRDDEIREFALINADGPGLEIVVPADQIGDFNRPHPRLRPQ